MYINFSDIPGHQNLFLDYLYEFENTARFFRDKNFRDTGSYEALFSQLADKERPYRKRVTEIIQAQYEGLKPSKQTQNNIEALNSNKTIAVVTGQQLGLFGGPLYTFHKTITAIKLCAHLKEKFDGYQFVPVFWLEGDDHDFDEVRTFTLIGNDNQPLNISYEDGEPEDFNRGSVSDIKFNDNLNKVFDELSANLRDTEFKPALMELLQECYTTGKTFKDAFKKLLFKFFDEYGLVLFDPVNIEVKKLLQPVFRKEITDFRNHTKDVVETSAELEEVYHAQVKVKPINLFMLEEDERLLIEPVENNEYRLKGKRKRFTQEELLSILDKEPERFSSNVLLRPICQDYILPTAFYIAGPSEISYFAQVIPLYEKFSLVQPFVYPRSSATIVEKGIKGILEKYELQYGEVFTDDKILMNKLIGSLSEVNLNETFAQCSKDIELAIDGLKEKLFAIDKTLNDLAVKTNEKILQTLDNLKSKAEDAEKRRHEAALRQITKALNAIYPANTLQERQLNFIYFAHKYGLDIIKLLYNELTINKFEHQIIEL